MASLAIKAAYLELVPAFDGALVVKTLGREDADAVLDIDQWAFAFDPQSLDPEPVLAHAVAWLDCAVTAMNIDGKSNCELTLWDPLSDADFPVGKASTSGKIGVKVGSVAELVQKLKVEAGVL